MSFKRNNKSFKPDICYFDFQFRFPFSSFSSDKYRKRNVPSGVPLESVKQTVNEYTVESVKDMNKFLSCF